jgi:hypothetical protein
MTFIIENEVPVLGWLSHACHQDTLLKIHKRKAAAAATNYC